MKLNRIILILAFASFSVSGCSNGNGSEATLSGSEATLSGSEKNEPIVAANTSKSEGDAAGKTIQLTKQDFLNKIMNYEENPNEWNYIGDKPAIIDFYAEWCGPCKIAAPVLEELAKEYKGEIYIYKVDTEVERELAAVFGIRSIPSFLFIPEDGRPTMSNGIARTPEETKEMFKQMIDEILLGENTGETL